RARIAQSSALPPVADEPASPLRDVSQGKACPTDSGFKADQDRANIAKTFTLPHESTSRVTSLAADEGSMQHKLDELTALCISLQRQHSEMVAKFEAQELEINRLKVRVKLLEDREGVVVERSRDDAPIKGRNLDEGEAEAKRVRVAEVPTGSGSIPTVGPPAAEVPTSSDVVPTAGLIFATATVEEELQMMINSLDRSNETVLKYLQEYKQFAEDLSIEERVELINDLIKYQENYAQILKYQTQQRKPWPASSDKEMELWVELKRLYEPDVEDQLWTHTQNMMHAPVEWKLYNSCEVHRNMMHAPVEWKLYNSCGVHRVTSKNNEIFMLIEKDYPLRKGLAIVMISYKLQVENYSKMANDLILKIYNIASSPRQQGD
nr:hypothetical protein [Tanacetum cinerariifolium]